MERRDNVNNTEVSAAGAPAEDIIYIRWTFVAAMHQTSPLNKEKYSEIKNKFLSYRGSDGKRIRNTEFRRYSIFYDGHEAIARVTLRQNLLKIFFAPQSGGSQDEWTEYKIRTRKTQGEVIELIDEFARLRGWQTRPRFKVVDYAAKFPRLSNVVLVKRARKPHAAEKEIEKDERAPRKALIEALWLCSCEHIVNGDGSRTPVLKNINLSIEEGDTVGLGGDEPLEVKLLCEILGNMRPYYKGFLRLGDIGSKRDKRYVLAHTYFLDGTGILYERMTVLEQILFTLYKRQKSDDALARQRAVLDLLVDYGLRDLALKKISTLTLGQRLLVCVVIAAVSDSPIVVLNLTDYNLSQDEAEKFACVAELLRDRGKTSVIATLQPKLIGMACTMAAFVGDGEIEYYGTVEQLLKNWDKVACLIRGEDIEKWGTVISDAMQGYKCMCDNGVLYVRNHTDVPFDATRLYEVLSQNGIVPDSIKFNKGRVENSFEELSVKYDI